MSCRTNHFSKSVQIEPAERQERIPTESQKEKEGERLKKGMKAYCRLNGNICEGRKNYTKKKERMRDGV